jgi:Ala-tRNA(Pro) deacylase
MLIAKLGKKATKYMLGVIPGDWRLNLPAVKSILGATYVSFASADVAERLAGASLDLYCHSRSIQDSS